MKQKIKKAFLRFTAFMLFVALLLLVIILNPVITYANKTTQNNFTIYHNQALSTGFFKELDIASQLLKSSEFYTPQFHLDICLNDGSLYPELINKIHGSGFAFGFYDKVVMQGSTNYANNYAALNGYKWNLTQLLAHEMTHCLQFNYLGFMKSNPVAEIPEWKWEGYAEYISRKTVAEKDFSKSIAQLLHSDKEKWAVVFADSTIAPRQYIEYWTLVRYCMDIKKMSYLQLLKDTTKQKTIQKEMMNWYEEKQRILLN